MDRRRCLKCGSSEILIDVRVMDRGDADRDAGDLLLTVDAEPQAWLFKGKTTTALSACVCAQCGYTELYADNPRSLAKAAIKAAASRKGR